MRRFDYQDLAKTGWDMDILNLIARIREHKGRQDLYIRQKPAELTRLVSQARIQSTEASNRIEGIVTTRSRMKLLMLETTVPQNRNEQEIVGYRDVLNTIHINHADIPVRVSYILQLHRDLLRPAGLAFGGRLKSVQNYISETRPDGTTVTRFTPTAPYETEAALTEICTSYQQAIASEHVEPLILIPVFISDFLCIHPFNDGNGRMSRLLTLLLLYKSGFNVGKYISIEKEIEKTKDSYYDTLEQVNAGWHEGANKPLPFIRYFLQIILSCYTQFEENLALISVDGVKSSAYEVVARFVEGTIGRFSGAEAVANCPSLSRSSVLAALGSMVSEGRLLRIGKGRSTVYLRADSVSG